MAQLDSQTTTVLQQLIAALGLISKPHHDENFRRASDDAHFPMTVTKRQIAAANAAIAAGRQALAASAAAPTPSGNAALAQRSPAPQASAAPPQPVRSQALPLAGVPAPPPAASAPANQPTSTSATPTLSTS